LIVKNDSLIESENINANLNNQDSEVEKIHDSSQKNDPGDFSYNSRPSIQIKSTRRILPKPDIAAQKENITSNITLSNQNRFNENRKTSNSNIRNIPKERWLKAFASIKSQLPGVSFFSNQIK
jgi:hypothetical protein